MKQNRKGNNVGIKTNLINYTVMIFDLGRHFIFTGPVGTLELDFLTLVLLFCSTGLLTQVSSF